MIVLFYLIIGAAAGFVATRIMRLETDILTTVGIGVLGALLGGLLLRFLIAVGTVAFGFIGAVLGALVLIWAWNAFVK